MKEGYEKHRVNCFARQRVTILFFFYGQIFSYTQGTRLRVSYAQLSCAYFLQSRYPLLVFVCDISSECPLLCAVLLVSPPMRSKRLLKQKGQLPPSRVLLRVVSPLTGLLVGPPFRFFS